uniref:DDE_3 domain-containing protein n=1 Tax=Haemonchus contortus TaxID=6289 RepID=A0A7I4YET7_HAECO
MVWAGVCASGKTPLIFVDRGVKIDKDYYLKTILEDALLSWANSHFSGRPWTFQPDSALAYKAKSKASATPHPNLDSLKAALIREWDEIDDALLRPVIDAFSKRLRAAVRAKGGRIEK